MKYFYTLYTHHYQFIWLRNYFFLEVRLQVSFIVDVEASAHCSFAWSIWLLVIWHEAYVLLEANHFPFFLSSKLFLTLRLMHPHLTYDFAKPKSCRLKLVMWGTQDSQSVEYAFSFHKSRAFLYSLYQFCIFSKRFNFNLLKTRVVLLTTNSVKLDSDW